MGFISAIKTTAKNLVKSVMNVTRDIPIVKTVADNFISSFDPSYATVLAGRQAEWITMYGLSQTPSEGILLSMELDPWVAMAAKVAPSNLVIRQWCLIDLFRNRPTRKTEIYSMMLRLSFNGALWLESYSYWEYLKLALDPYITKFNSQMINPRYYAPASDISYLRDLLDLRFQVTSYKRSGVFYPIPMGDVYNTPLTIQPQTDPAGPAHTVIGNLVTYDRGVDYGNITYAVLAKPQGLNVHIPKDNYTVRVVNGVPQNFTFYTGIGNKYPTTAALLADTFDIKRIRSI